MWSYHRQSAPTRTPSDWLSRDPTEVDRSLADPLCGTPPDGTLVGRLSRWQDKSSETREHLQRIPKRVPILMLAGTRDPVGENGRGVRRLLAAYQAAGLERVSMKLYYARHELVNETIRETVTADMIAWLDHAIRVAG
jgi:alpha-beta hydrolase superfamily lysophospholipase